MKNRWITFFTGIISVKITGKGLERYLNTLIKSGLFIWNVRRNGIQSITFKMKLNDVSKLRKISRGSGLRIEFIKKEGLPFLFKRLLMNSGFLVGAISFLVIITILSNMIWGIQIKGAEPATEYKINKELDKMGVKVGKLQFFVDNVESIQRQLTNNIEELTWIGVELQGTTYHLQVVEKNEPEKPKYLSPQHLVAKKKAVIVDMFVEEGQAVVDLYDRVEPGQLLVSGIIGKEGQNVKVPAKGEIWGETWYKTSVEIPVKTTFQVYNGNEKRKHSLKIGNVKIPIWGFGKIQFKEYETETNEKKINFLKWTLPISLVDDSHREKETETRIYSNEEAIDVAKKMARLDLKNKIPEDAKIIGEKILHQQVDSDKVTVSIHFQIVENIANGQPIIQGVSE